MCRCVSQKFHSELCGRQMEETRHQATRATQAAESMYSATGGLDMAAKVETSQDIGKEVAMDLMKHSNLRTAQEALTDATQRCHGLPLS